MRYVFTGRPAATTARLAAAAPPPTAAVTAGGGTRRWGWPPRSWVGDRPREGGQMPEGGPAKR